jgi:hypothetical protein
MFFTASKFHFEYVLFLNKQMQYPIYKPPMANPKYMCQLINKKMLSTLKGIVEKETSPGKIFKNERALQLFLHVG